MKKLVILLTLICLFIVLLSGVSLGATVTTIPLTGAPTSIDISGHRVVYTDEVSHDNNYIHVYDFGTGVDTSINSTDANREDPTIDGDRIVWYEGAGAGLYLYDMSAPIPGGTFITGCGTPPNAYTYGPAMSGTALAWQIESIGNTAIFCQNPGPSSLQITSWLSAWGVGLPDVSGNYIVWHDDRTAHDVNKVFYDDITSHVLNGHFITSALPVQMYPRISGNNIVYCDGFTNSQDIYLYPLPGGPEQKITDDSNKGWNPDISGDYIVWEGGGQIYMYNIADGSTTQLTTGPDQYTRPRIDGNHIVWLESTEVGPAAAFLATIQDETPPATPELPYTGR